MSTLITILILIASVLMIGIVLIQKSKGGGLASNFASSNQIMGVRKTTDVIEKTTWILAVAIIVLCIASVAFMPKAVVATSVVENQTQEVPVNKFDTPITATDVLPEGEVPTTEATEE